MTRSGPRYSFKWLHGRMVDAATREEPQTTVASGARVARNRSNRFSFPLIGSDLVERKQRWRLGRIVVFRRKFKIAMIPMSPERIEVVNDALALEELRLSTFMTKSKEIEAFDIQKIRADAVKSGSLGGSRVEMQIEARRVRTIKEYFEEAVRLRNESIDLVPELEDDEHFDLLAKRLEETAKNYYQGRADSLRRAKAGSGYTHPTPGSFEMERTVLAADARRLVELLRRTRKLESSLNTQSKPAATSRDTRKVFVVHGRNMLARDAMFEFLRSIDLSPIEWTEAVQMTGKAAPYVGDILDTAFREAQAVVVLLTGDDMARLGTRYLENHDGPEETELTPQARPNVLFEAGLAFGIHPERTVLVALGKFRSFSDIGGRHILFLSDEVAKRQAVALRLKTAGCSVNIEARMDWHRAGNFAQATLLPDECSENGD